MINTIKRFAFGAFSAINLAFPLAATPAQANAVTYFLGRDWQHDGIVVCELDREVYFVHYRGRGVYGNARLPIGNPHGTIALTRMGPGPLQGSICAASLIELAPSERSLLLRHWATTPEVGQ